MIVMDSDLSESLEDYLEAALIILLEKGKVRVKYLSEQLRVSPASVTEALKKLEKLGYVKYEGHGKILLTSRGHDKAEEVLEKHLSLFNFLHNVLGVDRETAEVEACKMEHILSRDTLNKMAMLGELVSLESERDTVFRKKLNRIKG